MGGAGTETEDDGVGGTSRKPWTGAPLDGGAAGRKVLEVLGGRRGRSGRTDPCRIVVL